MSQFISLRVLASLGLGRSKKTGKVAITETPRPPVAEPCADDPASGREEPSSASRIRVDRERIAT